MSRIAYTALWLFVFSIPWERILALPGVSIVARVTGSVAVALALLAAVMSGRLRRWHLFHVAALLFVIWAACVLWLTGTGPRLPNKFWTWPQLLLVVWMIWEIARTEQRLIGLFGAYVCGAYVAAFDTIRVYRNQAEVLRRFAAGGGDANDLAMILALALPMAWYLMTVSRRPLLRWFYAGYVPAAAVAIGLTGSRGGMLASTVGLLIVPLSMLRLSPARLAGAVIMLVAAGAAAIVYTPETLIQRFATTGSEIEGGRLGGRGKLWKAGLEAFSERPLAGYGTGMYRDAITPMLGDAAQTAHNSFLSVLVEQGVVGFLIYVTMFAAVWLAVLNLPRLERRFALVLLATLMVTMLPLTWEDRRAVWFILPALLGLAQAHLVRRATAAAVPAGVFDMEAVPYQASARPRAPGAVGPRDVPA